MNISKWLCCFELLFFIFLWLYLYLYRPLQCGLIMISCGHSTQFTWVKQNSFCTVQILLHPFPSTLSGFGFRRQQSEKRCLDVPVHAALLEGSRGIPRPQRRSPFSVSRSSPSQTHVDACIHDLVPSAMNLILWCRCLSTRAGRYLQKIISLSLYFFLYWYSDDVFAILERHVCKLPKKVLLAFDLHFVILWVILSESAEDVLFLSG